MIQAQARMRIARRLYALNRAAAKLQRAAGGRLRRKLRAAVLLQAHFRMRSAQRSYSRAVASLIAAIEGDCAALIQSLYRARVARQCFRAHVILATRIQAFGRMAPRRADFLNYLAVLREERMPAAAVAIQSFARMILARLAFATEIFAAVMIQAHARRLLAGRHLETALAARAIQAVWRPRQREVNERRARATVRRILTGVMIQAHARRLRVGRIIAAVMIQAHARRLLAGRALAARAIQAAWRERQRELNERSVRETVGRLLAAAAARIQRGVRGRMGRRAARAATVLQRNWRCCAARWEFLMIRCVSERDFCGGSGQARGWRGARRRRPLRRERASGGVVGGRPPEPPLRPARSRMRSVLGGLSKKYPPPRKPLRTRPPELNCTAPSPPPPH
jgi:hypothetical protein